MKPPETVVQVGSSPDVQIVSLQLGIGAKDSPNHLVAVPSEVSLRIAEARFLIVSS